MEIKHRKTYIRIHFNLDELTYYRIKEMSEKTHLSKSEIVRIAVNILYEQWVSRKIRLGVESWEKS